MSLVTYRVTINRTESLRNMISYFLSSPRLRLFANQPIWQKDNGEKKDDHLNVPRRKPLNFCSYCVKLKKKRSELGENLALLITTKWDLQKNKKNLNLPNLLIFHFQATHSNRSYNSNELQKLMYNHWTYRPSTLPNIVRLIL